jgi:hypothetical protein
VHVNWSGLLEVFVVALVAGVGLVALFSLGLTALDRRSADGSGAVAIATAVLCFAACAAVVCYGLYLLIAR